MVFFIPVRVGLTGFFQSCGCSALYFVCWDGSFTPVERLTHWGFSLHLNVLVIV